MKGTVLFLMWLVLIKIKRTFHASNWYGQATYKNILYRNTFGKLHRKYPFIWIEIRHGFTSYGLAVKMQVYFDYFSVINNIFHKNIGAGVKKHFTE